jgi:uncharacterized protein
MTSQLIIFTRYPIPGQAKTRLIPALGAAGAAQLQRRMTQRTIATAQQTQYPIQIQFCGGSLEELRSWLGADLAYEPQAEGDLGDRMDRAFAQGFAAGCDRVVTIGTDCPSIDRSLIDTAFAALEFQDLVLGPAADGGYYLIGLRRRIPELFQSIDWSTDRVLIQTLAIAQKHGITYHLLPELTDIDRPEDLVHLPPSLAQS